MNIVKPTKQFDTAFIPPAYVSFVKHIKRVNYQVGIWKRSHENFPCIPNPTDDQGWIVHATSENSILLPNWFDGDMLPQTIINGLPCDDHDNTEDGANVDEHEIDDVEFDGDYSQFINELFNESEDEEEFEGFNDNDM